MESFCCLLWLCIPTFFCFCASSLLPLSALTLLSMSLRWRARPLERRLMRRPSMQCLLLYSLMLKMSEFPCTVECVMLVNGLEHQPHTQRGKGSRGGSLLSSQHRCFTHLGSWHLQRERTGSPSVLEPPCSGNLFVQHVMFHVSSPLHMPCRHVLFSSHFNFESFLETANQVWLYHCLRDNGAVQPGKHEQKRVLIEPP